MVSRATLSRESYFQTSALRDADWMRGRTRLPLRTARSNLPREKSRLSPDLRGYLAYMNERDFASVFPPPLDLLPSEERRLSRTEEGGAQKHGTRMVLIRAGSKLTP